MLLLFFFYFCSFIICTIQKRNLGHLFFIFFFRLAVFFIVTQEQKKASRITYKSRINHLTRDQAAFVLAYCLHVSVASVVYPEALSPQYFSSLTIHCLLQANVRWLVSKEVQRGG